MPGISLTVFAEKSRPDRFRMKALVELRSLSERQALAELYPKARSNRSKKLSNWKGKGLWPVPDSEIQEHLTQYNTIATQIRPLVQQEDTSAPLDDTQPIDPEAQRQFLQQERERRERRIASSTQDLFPGLQYTDRPALQQDTSAPQFNDATVAALKEIVAWWRERQDESMILSPSRPVFKGPRRNSGFHINAEILKRAATKLKKDKVRTGGSMSLLMEILLWEYLGRPQDVLESVPHDESDAWAVLHATPPDDYED